MFTGKPARAYTWDVNHGANLTIGFDDNFRLSPDDELDTTSTNAGVFANIEGATEISNIRLSIGVNGTTYSESSIDDDSNYSMSLDTARAGERLSGFLNVALASSPTTETELLDTGFLDQDGTRDSVIIKPGLTYQVDERNSFSANLSLQDVSYDTVSLTEYTDNVISLSWGYQIDETSSVFTSLQHSVYDPDDEDDDTDTNSLYLGYQLSTSEVTTYNFSVGYSEVERPNDSEDGSDFAFDVNYQTDERNNFTLGLSNSFVASGEGDVRDEDRLNLQWNHGLSGRVQFTLSADGVSTDDRDYYSIRAGGNYRYNREIMFSASYRYSEEDRDTGNADSSAVFFSLSYTPI